MIFFKEMNNSLNFSHKETPDFIDFTSELTIQSSIMTNSYYKKIKTEKDTKIWVLPLQQNSLMKL